jgi:hypothetical protein
MSVKIHLTFVLPDNGDSIEVYKTLFANTDERDDVATELVNDHEFKVVIETSDEDPEVFFMQAGLEHKLDADDEDDIVINIEDDADKE